MPRSVAQWRPDLGVKGPKRIGPQYLLSGLPIVSCGLWGTLLAGVCHPSLYFCPLQAPLRAPDSVCGCLSPVRSPWVVATEPRLWACLQFGQGTVPAQLDFLLLHAAPQSINELVAIQRPLTSMLTAMPNVCKRLVHSCFVNWLL
jgi:hypothetical protein